MTQEIILKEIRLVKREIRLIKKEVKLRNLHFKRFLTVEQAAIVSGVSKSHIQKLVASKKLPHSKPTGKLVFIQRKDLFNFLSQNYISSDDELGSNTADFILNRKRK